MSVQAMGLGTLKVHSGLDEPLNAQIELISASANEIKTLKTTLASRADFEIAGVERAAHLFDIKYSVSQKPGGQHVLKLTTDNPVREPFLHFLIQVEWSGGRLIREYSALLDPPHWVGGRPAEISVPETVVSEPAPSAPSVTAAPSVAAAPLEELPPLTGAPEISEAAAAEKAQLTGIQPAPPTPVASTATESLTPTTPDAAAAAQVAPSPPAEKPVFAERPEMEAVPAAAAAPAPVAATGEYGPVKTGDTLSRVVERIPYDKSLTSQQVMLALLRSNPSAFFDNNVNNLKAGAILAVPENEAIAAIPRDQASREFRAQYDAWQEYKLKLAGASRAVAVAEADTAAAPKAEQPKKAGAKKAEKPSKADKAVKGKAEAVDLLKIVRANLEQDVAEESTKTPGVETKKDAAKEQKALTERVATLEEAIESKQIQNKEMRERVGKLQDQVKNTERLIELENKDLAQAQKQAAAKQAADAKAAEEKAALEKAAAAAAVAQAPAQPEAKPAEAAEAAKPAPPQKPAVVAPVAKAPVAPPPAEEGFLDGILSSLTDNSLPMALLGVVAVLAAGLAGLYAVRRRRASREFTESILSGSSLSSDVSSSVSDTGSQVAASDTSFLSDFSQGGMGNVHTDEVDPIAEAEVYLAYGRDEQAEEILKDAIIKDPVRQELKGKLLEIYFQRNDVGAFETLAEELYAALEGKGGKIWDKVEDMGRKLSPNNPMFRGGKPAGPTGTEAAAMATAPAAATTLLVAEPEAPADQGGQEPTFATQGMDQGLDFAAPSAAPADTGLDFSLDFNVPTENASAGEPVSNLNSGLDFDMGTTATSAPASSGLDMDFNLGESPTPDKSSSDIDFDLPGSTGSDALDYSPSLGSTDSGTSMDFSLGDSDSAGGLEMEQDAATATAEAGLPGWDETATKLDLAKAYIDMGDADGARSILDEVIAEGNESQKQQARDLASQIAA